MPILKTKIFGKDIEINYQENEKDKLNVLIDNFKNRIKEFDHLEGKVGDIKILFLAALKSENENFELINKKKNHSTKLKEFEEKIREVVLLKDEITKLNKKNSELSEYITKVDILIKNINSKVLSIMNKISSKK
tara:strand:- start:576 stop:977 length:402 start_codon:yes stop_codon:yes gene_type:complete